MQVEDKKIQSSTSEFPEDAFLIFIGHSDDATTEAHAIYDLHGRLEKDFRTFLKTNHESPFKSLMLWEWRIDASSKPGGQNAVVTPVLNRAQIIIFVFKERVGTVTSEEIENARELSKNTRINILAFFPAYHPESSKLNNKIGARDWANLQELQDKLTKDWSVEDSTSVTPCLPLYADIDDLKNIALDKLRDAMRDVIADIKCLKVPKHSTTYSSKRIIGYIKDISFDRRPVLIHKVEELDKVLVEKFLLTEDSLKELPQAKHSSPIEERLAILGCVTGNRPTLGAFLCFAPSRLIKDKFGSCSLEVVRFKGVSRMSSRVERYSIHDNLLNLFDQGINWLTSEAHLGRQGRVGSTDRDDLEIPKIALREALANALVHRDYEDALNRDQPTRVEVFDNRIEITSFGTLFGSVNIDQLNQYSDTLRPVRRNPIIADIFQHITHVELNASGISRMRYAMQKVLLPPPRIRIQNGAVVVCFMRPFFIDSNTRQPIELRKRALIGGSLSGLDAFRAAAFEVCFKSGYFPVMMEHHPNTENDEDDAIMLSNTMVDYADIYIGILTNQYGYVPDIHEKSITEIEYFRVKARKNLPRLLFSLKENIFEKQLSESEFYSQKQLNFREAVARESVLINVSTAEELKTQLFGAFKKLAYVNTTGHSQYDQCYQTILKEELGYIRMLGLPGVESIKVNLNNDTFVPLRLSHSNERGGLVSKESDLQGSEHILYPDEIMKQAFHDRRGRRMLLVIGDPGAGKTTLLKYYALCAIDDYTKLGFSAPVKVFYLPLRDLVRDKEGHCTEKLPATLAAWSEKHHQTIDAKVFNDWLNNDSSLVLLDGLDEISTIEERKEVCRWIDNAFSGFGKAFFVVTSRATGYRKDEGIELESEYERADVQDFTAAQQERFLRNWFSAAFLKEPCEKGFDEERWQEKQKAEAEKRTTTIVAHLKAEKNKGLRQLAAIPMILQIMAILWKDRDYMPESRVKLYEAALDYLLELRDKRRDIKPLLSAIDARQVLGPVSLWMQERLKKDEATKDEMHTAMQEWLDTLDTPPTAEAFCDYLVKRAGLLVETGGKEYLFRHKSFREYLAGIQLKEGRPYDHLNKLVTHFGEDWWEEPLRFFIASVDAKVFDAFMQKLFDSPWSDDMTQKQQLLLQTIIEEAKGKKVDALCNKLLEPATTTGRQRVILDCLKTINKPAALEALLEFREKKHGRENRDIINRTEEVILALGGQPLASKAEKSASGKPALFRNPNEQNAEYILISGGSYIYSVTNNKVIVEDLYVAKYMVTNRLYRLFIASLQQQVSSAKSLGAELKTIAQNNSWGEEFGNYLNKGNNDLVTLFQSEFDENRKFDGEDQPVVGITWYAAQAYCLWLSLFEPDKLQYRLPTEIEWEWAAGGKIGAIPEKVRKYPWRNEKGEPGSTLANFNQSLGATIPVGNYPDGATPEGLYDMAGNAWEWMANMHEKYAPALALRGGSWLNLSDGLRCSARSNGRPAYGGNDVGFRVVCSSSFSLLEVLAI